MEGRWGGEWGVRRREGLRFVCVLEEEVGGTPKE